MSNFKIPMADINIHEEAKANVMDCLERNWISSGKYVNLCNEKLKTILNLDASLCSSGTAGLHSALKCLDLPKNSRVIVPTCTFGATANAIILAGYKPLIVDIDMTTGCLSPQALNEINDQDVRALIYVHLYGVPGNDFEKILEICKQKNWLLIEDAAEAFGGKLHGKYLGSFGEAGIFSFFANKTISCGEGGCVVASPPLHERIQRFISHGMSKSHRYSHIEVGTNYRITDIQAALLLPQLDMVDHILQKRKVLFERLKESFERFDNNFAIINENNNKAVDPSFWLIAIRCKTFSRRKMLKLRVMFEKRGIETRPIFPPLHMQIAFKNYEIIGDNGMGLELFNKGFCLPVLSNLSTSKADEYIKIVEKVLSDCCD